LKLCGPLQGVGDADLHSAGCAWVGVDIAERALFILAVEQVLYIQVQSYLVIDLVVAQQVHNGVGVHRERRIGGLAGTLVDILSTRAQAQAFEGAVLEFVDVKQAEAVAGNVQQARAGANGVVLGDFGIHVGVTADHAPLGGDICPPHSGRNHGCGLGQRRR